MEPCWIFLKDGIEETKLNEQPDGDRRVGTP